MNTALQEQWTGNILKDSDGTTNPQGPPKIIGCSQIATYRVINAGNPTISSVYHIQLVGHASETPNPEVMASLQRSLVAHADVWIELSKY